MTNDSFSNFINTIDFLIYLRAYVVFSLVMVWQAIHAEVAGKGLYSRLHY